MEDLKLIAEPSLDPAFLKVTVIGQEILPDKILICESPEEAKGSPLFEAFFTIPEITRVMVSGNIFTFQKKGDTPWPEIGKKIGSAIRTAFASGEPFWSEELEKKIHKMGEDPSLNTPEAKQVKELLDQHINPAVASHGGRITLVDVKENRVFVKMEGGCQGCGMAMVTLKQGVEAMIKEALPHIEEVVDVTDHSKGSNPYYQSSKK
ncbi:MAG: hypothetical protein D6785_16115 [Planctomycetota bacterium]|nr:MAG: hypothetical protein D6785_16115 [Planctomycetota bacterium]